MRSAAGVMPSIADMLVCKCSSTRFSFAESTISTISARATAFGRMTFSRSYLSYSTEPVTSSAMPFLMLSAPEHSLTDWISLSVIEFV